MIEGHVTHRQLKYLKKRLRDNLRLIQTNIPPEVIAKKQKLGLANAREALARPAKTAGDVNYLFVALVWSQKFIQDNYEGTAPRDVARSAWMEVTSETRH